MEQIIVVPYRSTWPDEYATHVARLLPTIRSQIVRIDHIGSTAVPGLAAKDIIDIQIAVPALTEQFIQTMIDLGYRHHPHLGDNVPLDADPIEWQKQVFSEPPGVHRFNLHVRRNGAPNMIQALLFRDYLRAHRATATAHGQLKAQLAAHHPNDRAFYYAIKDPVFAIIWEAAQVWAEQSDWHHDKSRSDNPRG